MRRVAFITLLCILMLSGGCAARQVAQPLNTSLPTSAGTLPPTPTALASAEATSTAGAASDGLSADQVSTLESLERVDDYPLYTMRYYGAYAQASLPAGALDKASASGGVGDVTWACSLFAALGDAEDPLYGRNFDWEFSPALLLFTDPPDGYASVSMVDIAYLGFGEKDTTPVTDLPVEDRRSLLVAPDLPFDGMNEQGLAIGMAAVPPGDMVPDPGKPTLGCLEVIREILDHAENADEARAILEGANVDMGSGPPLHYLVADRQGHALLLEFYQGKMVVFPNESPWHQATNFLRAAAGSSPAGQCPRYDAISRQLQRTKGRLSASQAMELLSRVAQPSTQWSVVYHLSTGLIDVAMGRGYGDVHTLSLNQ